MMSQFNFDLDDFEMATPVDVTGCIRTSKLYAVSTQDSSICVSFANLNLGCSVLLDVADHPAYFETAGDVPVSLTLVQDKNSHSYVGTNLKILHQFNTLGHLPYTGVPVRELLTSTQEWLDTCPLSMAITFDPPSAIKIDPPTISFCLLFASIDSFHLQA